MSAVTVTLLIVYLGTLFSAYFMSHIFGGKIGIAYDLAVSAMGVLVLAVLGLLYYSGIIRSEQYGYGWVGAWFALLLASHWTGNLGHTKTRRSILFVMSLVSVVSIIKLAQ